MPLTDSTCISLLLTLSTMASRIRQEKISVRIHIFTVPPRVSIIASSYPPFASCLGKGDFNNPRIYFDYPS